MMSKSTVPVAIDCCKARVVVSLRKVDPVDLGACVGFPWLQEPTEQEVVQVLVVQPHEGQLNPGELALGDIALGGPKAHLANFLPVAICR